MTNDWCAQKLNSSFAIEYCNKYSIINAIYIAETWVRASTSE